MQVFAREGGGLHFKARGFSPVKLACASYVCDSYSLRPTAE